MSCIDFKLVGRDLKFSIGGAPLEMWHLLSLKLLLIIATICIKLSSVYQRPTTLQFSQTYLEGDTFFNLNIHNLNEVKSRKWVTRSLPVLYSYFVNPKEPKYTWGQLNVKVYKRLLAIRPFCMIFVKSRVCFV